ncbi:MAG: TonB-dependent receptor [Gemmatimonadaceae bacterium]
MRRSLAVVALIAGLGATAAAQGGTITGTITAANTRLPVAGATVEARGPGGATGSGVSNDQGVYRIGGLGAGTYALLVRRVDYRLQRVTGVRVSDGETTTAPVALEVVQLSEVVVTGVPAPRPLSEIPAGGSVVGERAIAERPALVGIDHVRDVPGVDVAGMGLVSGTVVARGFNNAFSGALLTLTDYRYASVPSLRVNTSFLTPTVNEDIGRIEVVLGPGAALYGPNSASGVMHTLTRSPFESPGTTLSVGGGERAVGRAALRHAGVVGTRFGYKIAGQYMRGREWEFVDSTEDNRRRAAIAAGAREDTLRIGRRDPDVERYTAEARLDFRATPTTDFVLSAGTATAAKAIELTGLGAAQAIDWRYDYLQARARSGRLFVQGFINTSNSGDSTTYLLRTGQYIIDKSRTYAGQVQHGFALGARQSFIYGVDLQRTEPRTNSTINGRNEDDDEINEVGGYIHSETRLSPKLDFFAAARVDKHSRLDDPVFSPRVAFVFKPAKDQNFRLTYNRAFSTPSTNNLFLDLLAQRLNPSLPYSIRTVGVPEGGLPFRRDCAGGLCMRSYFTGDPSLARPIDVAQVWAGLLPLLPPQARAVLSAFPAPTSAQVGTVLRTLDAGTGTFKPTTAADVRDVDPLRPSINNTYEVGYKGFIANRLILAADVYREKRTDFVGPLIVETPNVFLDPGTLNTFLTGRFTQAGLPPAQAAATAAQITAALAPVPVGTVTPESELTNTPDLYLTYRNFGDLDLWGADLSAEVFVSELFSVSGTYSWVSEDLFPRAEVGGPTDIALNAPAKKGTLGVRYRDDPRGLSAQLRGRYIAEFPVNSGAYIGTVPEYKLVDLNLAYRLPVGRQTILSVNVQNLFDKRHYEFVGAPTIGRLVIAQMQYTF